MSEVFTYLSVAKQTREFNDRHGKNTNVGVIPFLLEDHLTT